VIAGSGLHVAGLPSGIADGRSAALLWRWLFPSLWTKLVRGGRRSVSADGALREWASQER
jgi:hypothetical protein